MCKNKIIIFGRGGFAKEVAYLIENINANGGNWDIIGFLDVVENSGDDFEYGYPVYQENLWLNSYRDKVFAVIAIGNGKKRSEVFSIIKKYTNIKLATLIDPNVAIGKGGVIGEGSIITKNCSITVDTKIGKGVLLNIGSIIGHDSVVGDFTTVSPNAVLAGDTNIGNYCNFGSGSFVREGVKVVNEVTIAPLSGVYKDIVRPGTYSGNPARQIR